MALRQEQVSAEVAEEHVVNSRVFDCVNKGQFVFPDGTVSDADLKGYNNELYSPEIRQNLLDLAHKRLAEPVAHQQ